MNIVQLIYASRFSPGIGSKEINDILQASRANNPAKKVTGMLCYAPGAFLQCLEGPREEVNTLYRAIAADDRHRQVTILEYSDIRERAFGDWSMAYVRAEDLGVISEYVPSAKERFDPFEMTAGEALDFVTAIAKKRKDLLRETIQNLAS